CADEETGAFGFWDFKIPKAFRPKLFTRDPLTVQDSIYEIVNHTITNNQQHDTECTDTRIAVFTTYQLPVTNN
ncbi:hypothetical protein, partial [Microcoleus vaginatus]|uniref:hypothetical protein n=1 Tax=Microcoleus vaginatus TaxID=119532 RepID=UPI0032A38631